MSFNSFLFGTDMFGGVGTLSEVTIDDTLVFENFSLSDNTYMVMQTLTVSGPSSRIISGSIPRAHGRYFINRYFDEYVIEASGIVKNTSAALLDAFLDTIKKSLRAKEGNLDYKDANGVVKRFTATVDNFEQMFSDRQGYHITFCPFKIRFRCFGGDTGEPFGKAKNYAFVSQTSSSSPFNQAITNDGSYDALPVFILNFTAANTMTVVDVQRIDGAGTILDEIKYTGTIAANDILTFDSEQKSVTKNGTAVDYTGSFPILDVGANLIKITITGTSFTAGVTYKYKPAYL